MKSKRQQQKDAAKKKARERRKVNVKAMEVARVNAENKKTLKIKRGPLTKAQADGWSKHLGISN
jgi:hypothetical protein